MILYSSVGQCEVEGAPTPVGSLPAKVGENAPHNVFPDTTGDLDDFSASDIDREVGCQLTLGWVGV